MQDIPSISNRKKKLWDYFILCARFLLAWTLLSYGWGKLTENQFGLSPAELSKPVKDLGLFKLSWYLFDQQPFKSFIGFSQIIAGLLLLWNKTRLIGALIAVPILLNILIIDITFIQMSGFYWRLSYYLFLDLLILWHDKERIISVFKNLTSGLNARFRYPLWAYLILPVMAIVLELLGILPKVLTGLILHPSETMSALSEMPQILAALFRKVFS